MLNPPNCFAGSASRMCTRTTIGLQRSPRLCSQRQLGGQREGEPQRSRSPASPTRGEACDQPAMRGRRSHMRLPRSSVCKHILLTVVFTIVFAPAATSTCTASKFPSPANQKRGVDKSCRMKVFRLVIAAPARRSGQIKRAARSRLTFANSSVEPPAVSASSRAAT